MSEDFLSKKSKERFREFLKEPERGFDNQDRHRYYGLRRGDIVDSKAYNIEGAEVVEYGSDNNRVTVKTKNDELRDVVAEWCKLITKVEDR